MKKTKTILMLLAVSFILPTFVFAEETNVATYDSLLACVDAENSTCKLTADINLKESLVIEKTTTIDLNGHTIMPKEGISLTSTGIIWVNHGGTLTVNDSVGTGKIDGDYFMLAIQMAGPGDTANEKKATLVVNGGTITGNSYAISGNGNPGRDNTSVTINGGTLESNSTAIFQPQNGTLTVNGGTITGGKTGIEVRAGKITVNGGTITGNGGTFEVTSNGNGTTTTGAGIAVAQHTTVLETIAIINGGTINGYSPLHQTTPEEKNDITKISLTINGGTFNVIDEGTSAIYSEDFIGFINGGTFSSDVTKYVATGYEATSNNGVYTVAKIVPKTEIPTLDPETEVEEVVVGATDSEKTEEVLIESLEGNEELASKVNAESTTVAIEIADVKETDLEEEIIEAMEETAGKATIATYFDVTVAVRNTDDGKLLGTLSELSDEIELMVLLPEDLKNIDSKIKRTYYIIKRHVDENGKVTIEKLPASLSEDGNSLTFKTSEFSTYALAYEDAANVNEKNPTTSDNAGLYIILGLASLVGLAGSVLYVNKKRLSN